MSGYGQKPFGGAYGDLGGGGYGENGYGDSPYGDPVGGSQSGTATPAGLSLVASFNNPAAVATAVAVAAVVSPIDAIGGFRRPQVRLPRKQRGVTYLPIPLTIHGTATPEGLACKANFWSPTASGSAIARITPLMTLRLLGKSPEARGDGMAAVVAIDRQLESFAAWYAAISA